MVDVIDLVAEDFTITGSGRYLKTIEHDSLVIDIERNIFYWNSKGIYGDAFTWLTKVKELSYGEARKILGQPIARRLYIDRPPVRHHVISRQLLDSFYELGKQHRDYWITNRGYTHSTVDMFKLGYTGEWYTIPIIVEGKLANFQCRKIVDGVKRVKYWYRGLGNLPFNLDGIKNTNWTVLTEGPVDAIMCIQNNIPAIASSVGAGHFNPLWMHKLMHLDRMYVVFDNDAGGRQGLRRIGKILGFLIRGYTFEGFDEGYDVSDFFKAGWTKEEFMDLLQEKARIVV